MKKPMPNADKRGRPSPESVVNPFVSMSSTWRIAIAGYVLIWQSLVPLCSQALHGANHVYPVTQALLVIAADLLLLFPFLVRRLAGMPTGWLHPLIFPTLMVWAIDLMRMPQALLYPFIVWLEPVHQDLWHPLLVGWSVEDISLTRLKVEALTLLSLLSLYAGFFAFSIPVPNVRFLPPRNMGVKVFAVLGGLTLLFIWLVESSGGLLAHISSFALGRQRALEGQGHIVGLVNFMPVVLVLWYAFDARILRRPWFLPLLVAVLSVQFMTAGSRSAALLPVILLFAVWIFHNQRIPATRIMVLGVVALALFGVLGEVRTSAMGEAGRADFSALTEFSPEAALDSARDQLEARRRNSAVVPTVAFAGDEIPFLWGRTYVATLGFFIPSALWEGKPRGAGAHVGAMVFGNQTLEQASDYDGGGIPPGAVVEAYWNFHIPGVVLIFLLFGAFKRWLSRMFIRHYSQRAVAGFYIFSIFSLTSPATIVLIDYFRNTVFIGAFYYFVGVLRPRRRGVPSGKANRAI